MRDYCHTEKINSSPSARGSCKPPRLRCIKILEDPLAREVTGELAAAHAREMRRLSDLAFLFLNATAGDRAQAESLLDNAIDLLFEGGVLSTWRYRILLAEIRRGL